MAMPITVRQSDLDAAWNLIKRIHTPEELHLPMVVFGTENPPIPACFADPQHPFTKDLLNTINWTMVRVTAYITATEWHFSSEEVDNLTKENPRIAALRQRLLSEVAAIPVVKDLRNARIQMINNCLKQWMGLQL